MCSVIHYSRFRLREAVAGVALASSTAHISRDLGLDARLKNWNIGRFLVVTREMQKFGVRHLHSTHAGTKGERDIALCHAAVPLRPGLPE